MKNIIIKTRFKVLLVFLILGFFVCPIMVFGDTSQLKDKEVKPLLNAVQKKLDSLSKFSIANIDFDAQEQTAAMIVQKAIQNEMFSFYLGNFYKKITKKSIITTFELIGYLEYVDIADALMDIDKSTLKQAKDYLKDYLSDNNIKTAIGELRKYSYMSYKNNSQNPHFQYMITLKSLNDTQSNVVIEIYSLNDIEPPGSTKSQFSELRQSLPPFILRIIGKVEKDWQTYKWVGQPRIEVVFDQDVPEIEIPKVTWWDKTKGFFKSSWGVIESMLSEINPFQAAVGPELMSNFNQRQEIHDPNPIIIEINDKTKESEPIIKKVQIQEKTDLEQIQDIIDDIEEQIDILNQEILELTQPEPVFVKEIEEEIVETREEPETIVRKVVDRKTTRPRSGGGGVSPTPISYCQKSSDQVLNNVIINEIAWMGTSNSSNDEWIELKNLTDSEINLLGYQLLDKNEQIKVVFESDDIIQPNSFFLLERTNDDSVPNISADQIYTGSLNDTNESLYLFDPTCQLEDQVLADPDWIKGDKTEKKTMERSQDLSWHTYLGDIQDINGTPKQENTERIITPYSQLSWPMMQYDQCCGGKTINDSLDSSVNFKKDWEYLINQDVESTNIVIDSNGIIYFGLGQNIYALNPDSTLKYQLELENQLNSLAIGHDSSIYVGDNHYLYSLDTDGQERFKFEKEDLENIDQIIIDDQDNIYFTDTRFVYKLDSDGDLIWEQEINPESIVFDQMNIYSLNQNEGKFLSQYDLNGDTVWSVPVQYDQSNFLTSDRNNIYLLTKTNNETGVFTLIQSFDSAGAQLWAYTSQSEKGFSPIIDQNIVISETWEDEGILMSGMRSLSPSGEVVWEMEFPENTEIITQHIGLENTIFVGVSQYGQEIENKIYVVNSETGQIEYDFGIDGTFVSDLVIGNNNIYFLISKIDEATSLENTYLYSLSSGPLDPVIIPKFTESSISEVEPEELKVEQDIVQVEDSSDDLEIELQELDIEIIEEIIEEDVIESEVIQEVEVQEDGVVEEDQDIEQDLEIEDL